MPTGHILVLLLVGAAAGQQPHQLHTTLGISGTQFTLQGRPQFLLGCSYYAALSASDAWIEQDLRELRAAGFNWVRVWATWSAYGRDISVVDKQGQAREPWLTRLRRLIALAGELGMVVDVTLERGEQLPNQQAHLTAVRTLATQLKPYRNVYFDLANERNIGDARAVPMTELRVLRDAVKAVDPQRLLTASHAGDLSAADVRDYVETARVDFLAPHRPRRAGTAAETKAITKQYLQMLAELGYPMPVHYQEPLRRNFGSFQPTLEDFLTDARGALEGGAAGWCLHLGDNRLAADRRPRKVFDMSPTAGRLFAQIDSVEREVIRRLASHLGLR
jgi:hypothetical protein